MLIDGTGFFQDGRIVAAPPALAVTSLWSWRAPQEPPGASPMRPWSWSLQEHRLRQLGEGQAGTKLANSCEPGLQLQGAPGTKGPPTVGLRAELHALLSLLGLRGQPSGWWGALRDEGGSCRAGKTGSGEEGAGVKGTSWGCSLVSFAWEVGGQLRKRKKG